MCRILNLGIGADTGSCADISADSCIVHPRFCLMFLQSLNWNPSYCFPDGAGISDPCEKEATDAIGHLGDQQREHITASAQVSWGVFPVARLTSVRSCLTVSVTVRPGQMRCSKAEQYYFKYYLFLSARSTFLHSKPLCAGSRSNRCNEQKQRQKTNTKKVCWHQKLLHHLSTQTWNCWVSQGVAFTFQQKICPPISAWLVATSPLTTLTCSPGPWTNKALKCARLQQLLSTPTNWAEASHKPTDDTAFILMEYQMIHCCLLKHALRLSAFGQLHKVLGMDPLPSKMPKKPRSETPIDYTGTANIQTIQSQHPLSKDLFNCSNYYSSIFAVQIPPSTAYAPPMKRPIEEEEGTDDKSPNKKKKKLQKKCKPYLLPFKSQRQCGPREIVLCKYQVHPPFAKAI